MPNIKEKSTNGSNCYGAIYADGIRNFCFMKCYKGSFSIEAALILPVVLMCLILPIGLGVELHQDVKTRAIHIQQEGVMDVIGEMYRKEWVENFLKGFLEENEG